MSSPAPPARVLLYHRVDPQAAISDPVGTPPEMGLTTPLEVLEAHIAWLKRLGYVFVTAGQLAEVWVGGAPPPGIAVLTFDDGWSDALTMVAPCLNRLQVRATFFVCPGAFGNRVNRPGDGGMIMTQAQVRALHDAGMELASHTLSHPNVLELSDAQLRQEFAGSREAVEAITGEPCLTLAYPTGRHDPRVESAARRAGYRLAFACRKGPWRRFAAPRWQAPIQATREVVARRFELPGDPTPDRSTSAARF